MIPYGRQDISNDDVEAVIRVLRSDFLTQGPAVPAFERTVEQFCGAAHAIAVNSATSALHIACLALGVGPGDRVWTSPISFVASANCALYCGASIDFVDIDPRTYNMSVDRLREKLEAAARNGGLPKVVIPVHLTGQPCDMAAIHALSRRYGFKVIEDAAHAIGARYLDSSIGDCRFSDITVFSFHPVKIVTTAEGGMTTTNDADLAASMRRLRTHGITRVASEMTRPSEGAWEYQQIALGFNYRMTDLLAALGTSQMDRISVFLEARRRLAARYDKALAGFPLVTPWQHPDSQSAYHLYVIRLKLSQGSSTRRDVFDAMRAAGIGVNVHYIPVYTQPYYEALGFAPGLCPEAERYYAEAISLPMYATLTETQQDEVVRALTSAMGIDAPTRH